MPNTCGPRLAHEASTGSCSRSAHNDRLPALRKSARRIAHALARYSESTRGVSMLVMQNGKTIFEHYANGGSAAWMMADLQRNKKLLGNRRTTRRYTMDYSSSTSRWRTRSPSGEERPAQIANHHSRTAQPTDGIEGASRLQRPSNAIEMPWRFVPLVATRLGFTDGPSYLQSFSKPLRRKLDGRQPPVTLRAAC